MSGHKPRKLNLINGNPLAVVLLAQLTVSKGNNMISRKFDVICTGKFSKTTSGYKCLSHQNAREIMLLRVDNLHEKKKNHRKSSRETKF